MRNPDKIYIITLRLLWVEIVLLEADNIGFKSQGKNWMTLRKLSLTRSLSLSIYLSLFLMTSIN